MAKKKATRKNPFFKIAEAAVYDIEDKARDELVAEQLKANESILILQQMIAVACDRMRVLHSKFATEKSA